MKRLSRREVLGSITAVSLGTLVSACFGEKAETLSLNQAVEPVSTSTPAAAPTATATPEPPFVLPPGESVLQMMAGTRYQTPLHVFGSGRPGPILLALGGVHGNEPGGWLAGERVRDRVRPENGALLVIPRSNYAAIQLLERTTPELGDLNRLYPGDPNPDLPMSRMAWEIMETIRNYRVNVLVDMHESWAFYRDRPQNGTAYLGQTLTTFQSPPAIELVRNVVEAVNAQVRAPWEEFSYRDSPNRSPSQTSPLPQGTPANLGQPGNGLNTSSLGIPRFAEGVVAVLVEMGQQQDLGRRVSLHVDVLTEIMRQVGAGVA